MYLIIPPADVRSACFPTTSEQSDRARKCEVLTRWSLVWIRFWRARFEIGMAHGGLGGMVISLGSCSEERFDVPM
jgi:hypothetical protein